MKKFVTMLIAVVVATAVQAQNKPGAISGTVLNTENKPVDAATVQLLKATDKSLVKTAVTDKAGNFTFDRLAEGK